MCQCYIMMKEIDNLDLRLQRVGKMAPLKGLFLTAIFALLIFSLQNIDATQRCTKKRYYCPNTTISLDSTNLVVVREAQRNLSRNILSSPLLNHLSTKGKNFVAYVLSRIDTDSPTQLNGYFMFSIWSMIYLSNPNDFLSLCQVASFVNASVAWATAREPTVTVDALRMLGNSGFFLCTMVQINSLTQLGCENVRLPPVISTKCYRFGKTYQIELALDLFGRYLPCSVLDKLYALYSSTVYSDNVLAAMFTYSLTPLLQTLSVQHDISLLTETFNMLLFNNVSICCCAKRNKRFNEMCIAHGNLLGQNVNTMINDTILFDECATEPWNHV
ncbi:uncharacterized protein LOC143921647 [Arctopsyche grandis]|uniref:uncharacterized protein LOC143921647 n=1 Tax=Arctopsyche grandis TaxID=121162 RepID=UPI00406D882B